MAEKKEWGYSNVSFHQYFSNISEATKQRLEHQCKQFTRLSKRVEWISNPFEKWGRPVHLFEVEIENFLKGLGLVIANKKLSLTTAYLQSMIK